MMPFKDPWIIVFVPLCLLLVIWAKRRQQNPSWRFPSTSLVSSLGATWKTKLSQCPFYLRLLTIILFIVALAGPRSVLEETEYKTEGIDIVLAIDSSGSMRAEDFTIKGKRYHRLAVVKEIVEDFVKGRKHDRMGLVTFAALAYTVSPLTTDYTWLITNLRRIDFNLIKDGTAIGSAITSSLARLRKSNAESKVVILLTDGMNNAGKVDPLSAARIAQALGVKVYTIGAGTKGHAPFPVVDVFGRTRYQNVKIDIDEETLQKIAGITNAKYFRATDTESLRRIYQEIDALEKTEIEESHYRDYKELFGFFLAGGLLILLLELVLSNTLFLKLP